VWCHAVSEELNEFAYDAEVAGLHYGLAPSSRGMNLQVSGYQDKFPVLLRNVANKMVEMTKISEHTWNLVHSTMLRNLSNLATTKQPYQQAMEWEQRALSQSAMTSEERLKVFQGMVRDDMQGVSQNMLGACYAEVFLQGNVAEDSNLGGILGAILPILTATSLVKQVPPTSVGRIPWPGGNQDGCVLIRRKGTNPKEQNGAVVLTLQAADESIESVTLSELSAQVLSQRCFDELRTKQQLGYIVALQAYCDHVGGGFCGIKVIVQSEKHPAEVHRRIDAWLSEALATLVDEDASTDAQLAEYLQALLTLKREKPKKLSEEFSRNWNQVSQRTFDFARRDKVIAYLEGPQCEILSEFRKFVKERLLLAARMAVEISGAAADAIEIGNCGSDEAAPYANAGIIMENLETVEAFRQKLEWKVSNTSIVT